MWPGLEAETPRFGPPPLPPAWANCAAIVAARSAAAQIAIFFRVMRNFPVWLLLLAGAPSPADSVITAFLAGIGAGAEITDGSCDYSDQAMRTVRFVSGANSSVAVGDQVSATA